jgi:F0F1-type ATP synthase assembly protein I
MDPKPGPGRQYGEGYKYVSYGLTFAGGVIVFMLVGLWLDRRLGVMPLFTIAGTLLGSVLSFLTVYRKLEAERREGKDGGT